MFQFNIEFIQKQECELLSICTQHIWRVAPLLGLYPNIRLSNICPIKFEIDHLCAVGAHPRASSPQIYAVSRNIIFIWNAQNNTKTHHADPDYRSISHCLILIHYLLPHWIRAIFKLVCPGDYLAIIIRYANIYFCSMYMLSHANISKLTFKFQLIRTKYGDLPALFLTSSYKLQTECCLVAIFLALCAVTVIHMCRVRVWTTSIRHVSCLKWCKTATNCEFAFKMMHFVFSMDKWDAIFRPNIITFNPNIQVEFWDDRIKARKF